MSLYLRIAAYAVAAALLFGAGFKVATWRGDARYSALQVADVTARAHGEETVRQALQKQLDTVKTTSANNAQVIGRLQDENTQIAADRDSTRLLVQRLLNRPSSPAAPDPTVPKTSGGQPAAAAGGAGGNGTAADLLVAAAEECERNADRLDALSAQIRPQL